MIAVNWCSRLDIQILLDGSPECSRRDGSGDRWGMVAGGMLSSRGSKSYNVGGTWRFGTRGEHGHLAGLEGLLGTGRRSNPQEQLDAQRRADL